jgi:predicted lipoprotein with Yx(FWY)xxD motif
MLKNHRMSLHTFVGGAGMLAATLLLAACGGGGSYGAAGAPGESPSDTHVADSSSGDTVGLGKTSVGKVLVDAKGETLYAFAADSPGTSNCNGSCLQYWPPVAPSGALSRSPDVTASLATITRSDGTSQLTVNGWPVYTYAADTRPGQATGQGEDLSGGRWWVLSGTGAQIKGGGDADGY